MKRYNLTVMQVKEAINPYDFYLREMNIQKFAGKSRLWVIAGLCPFHEDNSPGSFKINLETGSFICFSCGEKGSDIIAYMQKKYDLPFKDALEKLAYEWRVS